MSINVLAICGSLRAKSTNRGLLRYAQAHAPDGMKIHLADLLDVPFYNADLAEKPAAVKQLLKQIGEADALLFGETQNRVVITGAPADAGRAAHSRPAPCSAGSTAVIPSE